MRSGTFILLIAIITVGVFGFAGMTHDMEHGSGNCVASLSQAAVCPQDAISGTLYHITAYRSFSEMTLASSLLTFLFALLLLAAAALAASIRLSPIPNTLSRAFIRRIKHKHSAPQEKFICWLARFENSPSVRCSA